MIRRLIISLLLVSFMSVLAACGDTWSGVRQDTGENLQAAGNAIDDADD
jgi:predicted small secreted protein